MIKLFWKLLAALGFLATVSPIPLIAPVMAMDLPVNTMTPIVCVMVTFSPMPPDANTPKGITVKRDDQIFTNLVPSPALRPMVAECESRHGFSVKKDMYILGLSYPRDHGPIRRHLTIVACSKLGSLAYDQVITPSRDFTALMHPIPSGSTLEKRYCN